MNTGFRTLWTLSIMHAFWGGACDALSFVVPPATQQALRAMRARVRHADGVLQVAVEVDDTQTPLVDSTGQTLCFGLQLRDPTFARYTDTLGLAAGLQPLFGNREQLDTIDAQPLGVRIVEPRVVLHPASLQRPLGLRLQTPQGLPRASTTLGATDASWSWDAGTLSGLLQLIEEDRPGHVLATQDLFVAAGLSDCWGAIELTVGANHLQAARLAQGHAFTLAMPARSDVLRYYVLLKPAGPEDITALTVSDDRLAVPLNQRLQFNRRLPPFGAGYLSPDLLDPGHTRQVVLFEANAPLARQARGPQGIGLHRSGEAVIANLPQPGADRNDAQFVVHLSQP